MMTLLRADMFIKHEIGTHSQHVDLLNQILLEKKRDPDGSPNSNDGCWRTSHQFNNIEWLLQEVVTLYRYAQSAYKLVNNGMENIDTTAIPKITYWSNVNKPGTRNTMHSHVSSHFSCVYYLQGTNTGPLRLINPANTLGQCNFSAPFARDFYFNPKDRDLILWPSWMPHEVETNQGTIDRVNIVFDISL